MDASARHNRFNQLTENHVKMKLTSKVDVDLTFHIVITEAQMRALDALAGYGTDEFLKCFYEKMGKAYLEPHEKGLRQLFDSINSMTGHLSASDDLRKQSQELASKYKI